MMRLTIRVAPRCVDEGGHGEFLPAGLLSHDERRSRRGVEAVVEGTYYIRGPSALRPRV